MPNKKAKNRQKGKKHGPAFPWRCGHCGKEEVQLATVEYDAAVRHDGRLHRFSIPSLAIPICGACGQRVFTISVDSQITDALRAHLHLLTPAQIQEGIKRIKMSQKEVARRLGIAEATLSRWLNECQIQSRAMDNLLRSFFAFPAMRDALSGEGQVPLFGLSDIRRGVTCPVAPDVCSDRDTA
jgi:DNA-binding transcriptional regulator YiaG